MAKRTTKAAPKTAAYAIPAGYPKKPTAKFVPAESGKLRGLNIPNINYVADAIEFAAKNKVGVNGFRGKDGVGFNMGTWVDHTSHYTRDFADSCKTAACIAGTCQVLLGPDNLAGKKLPVGKGFYDDAENIGRDVFGLWDSDVSSFDLFFAGNSRYDLSVIQPLHAVAVLRHLAKTGKADWTKGEQHTAKFVKTLPALVETARKRAEEAQKAYDLAVGVLEKANEEVATAEEFSESYGEWR